MRFCNFIFKPKQKEITEKVLKGFCEGWLGWDGAGLYWGFDNRELPEGYIKFYGEADPYSGASDMSMANECCHSDEPVRASDLTEHMMITLDEEGFFDDPKIHEWMSYEDAQEDERVSGWDSNNPKFYSFYERELGEVIMCLAASSSRIMSFYEDSVWVADKDEAGNTQTKSVPLVENILNMPIDHS